VKLGAKGAPGDWYVWLCLGEDEWNDGNPEAAAESFVIGEGPTLPIAKDVAIANLRELIRELEYDRFSVNG